jgi:hypothetical protein
MGNAIYLPHKAAFDWLSIHARPILGVYAFATAFILLQWYIMRSPIGIQMFKAITRARFHGRVGIVV